VRSPPAESGPVSEAASETTIAPKRLPQVSTGANTTTTSATIHVFPSTDFVEHLHEVSVRLDAAATILTQVLLGEVDVTPALFESLLGITENCRLQLKAVMA